MNQPTVTPLVDTPIDIKIKLAALWTSFMFLYIYVDYFHLYMPHTISDIQKGIVFEFDISQGFVLVALALASLPILMVFLSLALPARINRLVNICLASLHIPYMLFNLVGLVWIHMVFAAVVEVVLLGLIIWLAWTWPQAQKS